LDHTSTIPSQQALLKSSVRGGDDPKRPIGKRKEPSMELSKNPRDDEFYEMQDVG